MELEYSLQLGDSQIDYAIIPYSDLKTGEAEIDQLLLKNRQKINALTKEYNDLKIDADKWDYSISAISGVLAGVIDIIFVFA